MAKVALTFRDLDGERKTKMVNGTPYKGFGIHRSMPGWPDYKVSNGAGFGVREGFASVKKAKQFVDEIEGELSAEDMAFLVGLDGEKVNQRTKRWSRVKAAIMSAYENHSMFAKKARA